MQHDEEIVKEKIEDAFNMTEYSAFEDLKIDRNNHDSNLHFDVSFKLCDIEIHFEVRFTDDNFEELEFNVWEDVWNNFTEHVWSDKELVLWALFNVAGRLHQLERKHYGDK